MEIGLNSVTSEPQGRINKTTRTGSAEEGGKRPWRGHCALIKDRDPGKYLDAIGTSRKPKSQFPVNVVLEELSICVALVC